METFQEKTTVGVTKASIPLRAKQTKQSVHSLLPIFQQISISAVNLEHSSTLKEKIASSQRSPRVP